MSAASEIQGLESKRYQLQRQAKRPRTSNVFHLEGRLDNFASSFNHATEVLQGPLELPRCGHPFWRRYTQLWAPCQHEAASGYSERLAFFCPYVQHTPTQRNGRCCRCWVLSGCGTGRGTGRAPAGCAHRTMCLWCILQ